MGYDRHSPQAQGAAVHMTDPDDCLTEITPEMIEAGVSCFYELPELLGPTRDDLAGAVRCAYLAMLAVRARER